MNYTTNHHLPQWAKSDRILMDDFNEAMANIESSLTANAQAAAAAKSTASSAYSTASTALSSKPYAVGTYTGNGDTVTVNVGFRPSFVFISSLEVAGLIDQVSKFGIYSCATTPNGKLGEAIQLTASGFTAYSKIGVIPKLAESGKLYEFIAFK